MHGKRYLNETFKMLIEISNNCSKKRRIFINSVAVRRVFIIFSRCFVQSDDRFVSNYRGHGVANSDFRDACPLACSLKIRAGLAR